MKKVLSVISFAICLVMIASAFAGCATEKKTAKVIDIELTQEDYAFGVDKDQPELLEKVNAFIEKIQSNGKFDEICDHYFGTSEKVGVTSAELDTSKDQLVVATNASFEPFEFKEGDTYYGIDMEIAALLADELGLELVISDMDFDAVCLSVGEHKCDIAMAGLTVKEERKEYVTFSNTYYKASQKLIVVEGDTTFDDCKTAEDVVAKLASFDSSTTVGVQNGTTGNMYVTNGDGFEDNNFKVTCKGYKNGSLAVQDLLNGNIQYVVIDAAPAECIVKAYNQQ
jgi:arginine/lysine/histidine transporter system substrate-binding protein